MSFFQSLAAAFKGEPVTPRAPLGRSFVSPWVEAFDGRGGTGAGARTPIHYPTAIREAYLRNPWRSARCGWWPKGWAAPRCAPRTPNWPR
jgi:hypothetical protein